MQIRQGTFETNSSSVHSIAIRGESLLASREQVIIKFGEYVHFPVVDLKEWTACAIGGCE